MLWLRAVTVSFVIIGGLGQTAVVPRNVTEVSNGLLPGGIVMIGGLGLLTNPSETLGTPELPSFPGRVAGNTVSIVGTTVFSCGGGGAKYSRACYYLKAEDPTWRAIALPWPLTLHSTVTVQDTTLWFLQHSKLYSYDTAKDNDQFMEYSLGFPFTTAFCAVTNQSHTFIIGAGEGEDEVWVNRDPSKPTEWQKVADLLDGRHRHACLWFGNDIFVTGGVRDALLDSVEVLNVTDMTFRSTRPLVGGGRAHHQMAVLHDKPSVLGGSVKYTPSASIEVYEVKYDAWQTLNYTMEEGRIGFGLAQYTGPDQP